MVVEQLARDVVAAIPGKLVVVALLKGSFVFVADLARALSKAGATARVAFLRLSSSGLAKESAGEVHPIGDIPTDPAGRQVLLVDDISDPVIARRAGIRPASRWTHCPGDRRGLGAPSAPARLPAPSRRYSCMSVW